MGYAIFKVIHQPDAVGNRLKEVQDSVQVINYMKDFCDRGLKADDDLGPRKIRQNGQSRQFCAFSVSL